MDRQIVLVLEKLFLGDETVPQRAIMNLFSALDAEVFHEPGRIIVHLHKKLGVFHWNSNPDFQIGRGRVRDIRQFLESAGVKPH